jgi:DNA-binding transcriptional regulator YhcF (GntR family)
MGNSKRSDIYKDIVEALKGGNDNIHQIAESKTLNWKTVKVALDSLVAAGLVQSKDKKYILKQNLNLNEHTLLGLPLSKEQEKGFCEIANRIQQLSKKRLNKTFLQKAVVEVIKRDKIQNLPYGWYIYGECCVHKLEPDRLKQFGSNTNHDTTINYILKEFSEYQNTDLLLEHLYEKEHNGLYLHKLNMISLLKQPFSTETIDILKRELRQMLFSLARDNFPGEIFNYFDAFSSSVTMLSKLSLADFESQRMEIIEAFTTTWNLLSVTNFSSVKSYYQEHTVDYYFAVRETTIIDMLQIQLSKLRDLWPEFEYNEKMTALRKKYQIKS